MISKQTMPKCLIVGTGWYLPSCAKKYDPNQVVTLDISKNLRPDFCFDLSNVRVNNNRINNTLPCNYFDFIYFEYLPEINDLDKALENANLLLNETGILIYSGFSYSDRKPTVKEMLQKRFPHVIEVDQQECRYIVTKIVAAFDRNNFDRLPISAQYQLLREAIVENKEFKNPFRNVDRAKFLLNFNDNQESYLLGQVKQLFEWLLPIANKPISKEMQAESDKRWHCIRDLLITLGELYLKEHSINKAIITLQDALEIHLTKINSDPFRLQNLVSIYKPIIQCYLAIDDKNQAIQQAKQFLYHIENDAFEDRESYSIESLKFVCEICEKLELEDESYKYDTLLFNMETYQKILTDQLFDDAEAHNINKDHDVVSGNKRKLEDYVQEDELEDWSSFLNVKKEELISLLTVMCKQNVFDAQQKQEIKNTLDLLEDLYDVYRFTYGTDHSETEGLDDYRAKFLSSLKYKLTDTPFNFLKRSHSDNYISDVESNIEDNLKKPK